MPDLFDQSYEIAQDASRKSLVDRGGVALAMDAKQKVEHYYWDALPGRRCARASRARLSRRPGADGDNWLQPGMQTNPHQHPYGAAYLHVSGTMRLVGIGLSNAVRERDADSAECRALRRAVGSEAVLNLDIFSPIREDYRHLVEYQRVEEQG